LQSRNSSLSIIPSRKLGFHDVSCFDVLRMYKY